jgi:oxalate decarboxylase/phosphoglucose isomerase-like protein (cupin superfamily)
VPHEILRPGFERRDERGVLLEVLNGFPAQALLRGRMNAGAVMGNHYHKKTRVFFYLLTGEARIETVNVANGARDAFSLSENQGVFLEPGESHAIRYASESDFLMLKSLPYDPADPDTYPHPV